MDRLFTPLQQVLVTWVLVLAAGWSTLKVINYFSELISIVVTAALLAFVLNYPVKVLCAQLPTLPGGAANGRTVRLSRSIAASFVYLLVLAMVGVLAVTLVPPVLNQLQQLIVNLPELIASGQQQLNDFQSWSRAHHLRFAAPLVQEQLLAQVQQRAEAIATNGIGFLLGTFNWVIDGILVLVISFYLLLDGERLWGSVTRFFSPPIRDYLTQSFRSNLQRFFSGQLLLGLFMAVTLSLAFWWLQIPFFLVLSLFIGLMEVIPFIGATLGIITVGVLVAFMNWWLAVQGVAVAIALQQIKDNVLAPRILGNLTGLSPAIVLAALLLGGKVGGLLGVILAIPLAGMVRTVVELLLDPTLPPQVGDFFVNPFAPVEPEVTLECVIDVPATGRDQADNNVGTGRRDPDGVAAERGVAQKTSL